MKQYTLYGYDIIMGKRGMKERMTRLSESEKYKQKLEQCESP